MATAALILEENNKVANLLFNMIRTQNLDVKIKIQQLLSKDIDKQLSQENESLKEIKPYTLDELCGILNHDDGKPYDDLRKEYLKGKYQL